MIDALVITALQEEFDAAIVAASKIRGHGSGVTAWVEKDQDTATPYVVGKYVIRGKRSLTIALARPTRMGANSVAPVAAVLVERLKPHCLAMCGVCAGNPDEVALGDVIIAEMAYAYDEGKLKLDGFEGNHRQIPMIDTWVREAQKLKPDGLSSFGKATDNESEYWLLDRLYANDDPRVHPARERYFPQNTWQECVCNLVEKGLIKRNGLKLFLTKLGRDSVKERLFFGVGPKQLPFQIKVGPIASGNAVVKDGRTWSKLKNMGVRSVLGIEMEAAIIGNTAFRLGVPAWVVAKGVMDHADPRKDDRYKHFAALASAEVLFKFLERQLLAPGWLADLFRIDTENGVVSSSKSEFPKYPWEKFAKINQYDPNFARLGDHRSEFGLTLQADLLETTKRTFWFDASVRCDADSAVKFGPVRFALHPTYASSLIRIRTPKDGEFVLKNVSANEAYTIVAQIWLPDGVTNDRKRRILELSYDLNELDGLPKRFIDRRGRKK